MSLYCEDYDFNSPGYSVTSIFLHDLLLVGTIQIITRSWAKYLESTFDTFRRLIHVAIFNKNVWLIYLVNPHHPTFFFIVLSSQLQKLQIIIFTTYPALCSPNFWNDMGVTSVANLSPPPASPFSLIIFSKFTPFLPLYALSFLRHLHR